MLKYGVSQGSYVRSSKGNCSDRTQVIKRSEVEVSGSSSNMSSHKEMQNQESPRLTSTTVMQQQNPHSLRGGNRNELFTFFSWLVCAAGHSFRSLRDLLRCSSDSHLSRGEGTSPPSLAAHCWLLTQGMQISGSRILPVTAALPALNCLWKLSSLELAQQLPEGTWICLVPLGVNPSSLWQRTWTENQTKQIKLVTGD